MARKIRPLKPNQLHYTCEKKCIPFKTTDDAPVLKGPLGQERATRALEFGLRIKGPGFNLFIVGTPGSGRSSTASTMIRERAGSEEVPDDWAYVYNFENARSPVALSFPPGQGRVFVRQIKELVELLKTHIPAALEDREFEASRNQILEQMGRQNAAEFEDFQRIAREHNYAFEKVENEFAFIPMKDGVKLQQDEFNSLPDEAKSQYGEALHKLQKMFMEVSRAAGKRDSEVRKQLEVITRKQVEATVEPFVGMLMEEYPESSKIQKYLELMLEDIVQNFPQFLPTPPEQTSMASNEMAPVEPPFSRYQVNLIVDRVAQEGAPVIKENHPSFQNLIGKMEYTFQSGVATTSYEQIQPGALHHANGGYLILDALEVLRSPFAWEALKNSLMSGLIKIEDMGEQYRMFAAVTLKPEPIPLSVKIILIGSPYIYHQLLAHEEDFRKLFKVKADFGSTMKRTNKAVKDYSIFIASLCREENLLPFDLSGMGAVIEHGVRMAEDQNRLTTSFYRVADLVRESSFWAKEENASIVSRNHVLRAVSERKYRYNMAEERIGELIEEGTLMVQTKGQVVGQVNGLSVYSMGDYRFGKPTRITAKVFLGKSGMVNIEREVKLSGSIHNKGVLIVSSYLAMRYAPDFPLGLSSSVTFEQTYDEVDGDSATAAELVTLTSALAEVPIFQNIAITGSMDQHGRIQPIGGVNEKIEGFFASCREHGLEGDEGVVIPKANLKNLQLSEEVVEAVSDGKFSIYAIETIDEAIETLTGMKAGERGKSGKFPKDSFNQKVEDRLRKMAEVLRQRGNGKDNNIQGEAKG
ncbi:MAG: ATP-binding protein [Pseudomonadota bacterium]|jgi:lon-related putative ATP-dependent protease